MQAAICFFSVNAKSNPRGWAKPVIGSAPCCFRGLVSVSNNAMLEERPMAQGILLWRQWPGCVSVGSVVYLLSICHLFFSFFYHSSPISKGQFCFPALHLLVFPLFSMKSLVCHLILAIVPNSIVSEDVTQWVPCPLWCFCLKWGLKQKLWCF